MDWLRYTFPVSGVDTWIFLPPLVMFLIASATSMGGVTGAFILLPFNMSVLGYTGPGVTATNFVYNIVAIPLGVSRYIRAGHMAWGLLAVLVLGTLPGVFLGYVIRVTLMPDPAVFKPFVGAVLAYLAVRVFQGVLADWRARRVALVGAGASDKAPLAPEAPVCCITASRLEGRVLVTRTEQGVYRCPLLPVAALSLVVGVVGGAYGIGGGAVMAPFCIAVLGLPPFVVAGAALLSTWVTSVLGATIYALAPLGGEVPASPDWLLGGLFGLGGMAGVYVGARLQGKVPASVVKIVLGLALVFVAGRYLVTPLWRML